MTETQINQTMVKNLNETVERLSGQQLMNTISSPEYLQLLGAYGKLKTENELLRAGINLPKK